MRCLRWLAKLFLIVAALTAFSGCTRDPSIRKQKYLASGNQYLQKNKFAEAAIEFQNAIQIDKDFAPAHYGLAQCFLKQTLWSNAYRELSLTLALDPANWQAQLDLGNLLFGARQFAEARDRALTILNSNPNNVSAQLLLAGTDAELGNVPEALQDAQQAVQIAPDQPAPYLTRGLLQEQRADYSAAEESLQKAVSLDPKYIPGRLGLAGFYQRRKRWTDAEAQYNSTIEANRANPVPRASLASLYLAWGKMDRAEQTLRVAKQELPSDSGGYHILGDFYLATGQTPKALAEFASLLHEHPKEMLIKKHYIQLLIQDKQFDPAIKLVDELLAQTPKDADALILKGQTLNLQQKSGEAITPLQTAVKSNPDDPAAHFQLGISYAMTGNLPGAEKEWREAARLRPSMVDAQRNLATLALHKGDMDLLEQSASDWLKYAPTSQEGYLLRGTALLGKGDSAAAERDLRKAIEINPKNAAAYARLGQLRMSQGRFAESEKLFEQALSADPRDADALRQLAALYVGQKNLDKATNRIQAQIARVPDSSGFYLLLGQVLLASRRTTEAQAALSKSAELDKSTLLASLLLGQSQESSGQIDAAAATFERTIQKNPKDIRAYLAEGTLEERRGNWEKAQKMYEGVLKIQPDESTSSNNLSYLLLEHGGDVDRALALAQNARRAMPNSVNTADTLAWAYYKKGIYSSAIDLLEENIKKAPQDSTYYYHLGLAYEKSNKVEQARNMLQRALKIDPKSPHADEIHQALAELDSGQ